MTSENFIDSILAIVEDNTADPTLFLDVQNKVAKSFTRATKLLYDFTKRKTGSKTDSLPELIIDGFDEEQIWQQIELENDQVIPSLISDISKILASKELTQASELSEEGSEEKSSKKRKKSDDSDLEEENKEESDNEAAESAEDDSFSETESKNSNSNKTNKPKKRKQESSIVDDKFFKMQELNEYLNKEERKESKTVNKSLDHSDDESVDFFNDVSDNGEEDEETQNARLVKYADFFDSPESGGEAEDRHSKSLQEDSNDDDELESDGEPFEHLEDDNQSPAEKRVKFNLPVDSEDSNETDSESEKEEAENETKSSMEERQERLRKKIAELEKEAISEKPWQLKGEVSASNRPQNSLLEDFVEVDVVSRPPPVMTEQTTLKLEDIIRQRIKDKAWDDVEKKIKPIDTPVEYKKKLIMDQEKSKLSLAEIYEKEYIKQREALDPEQKTEEQEPKEHIEIREMMNSIFRKLDALSNFHYTPRPAQPELKIVSNIPAITAEEVAPVATSDATLLAPEEVQSKQRGDLLGKAERTKTDMKRELRKKKKKQRQIQQAKEKKEKLKTNSEIRKKRNKDSAKVVEKLTKSRNVVKMDEQDKKAIKSSTAFFNQLQDEVQSQIKVKASKNPGKKQKQISAVKLKL